MKREEEISRAANKYFDDYMDGLKGEVLTVMQTFEDAAKWADESMIKRAYEWIKENRNKLSRVDTNSFIELFKKAMEE